MNLLLTALYMGFILVVSLMNTPDVSDPFTGFDKVVHFSLYGVLGVLLARALFRGRRPGALKAHRGLITKAVAITFFYGLFLEFLQGLTPYRDASLFDALANGMGGVAGVFLYCLFQRYCKPSEGGGT